MPSTDPRELLDQATHAKNTQDEMDPLDAVLALFVHNTEVLRSEERRVGKECA